MKFISLFVLITLLFVVRGGQAETAVGHAGPQSPTISLNDDLSLHLNQDTPALFVHQDGLIHFQLNIPDLGEAFFAHHHVHINLPYFSKGSRKNNYIEIVGNGTIPVTIPSEEPPGTPIYLYDSTHKALKSTAERVITPIVQFLVVYKMVGYLGEVDIMYPHRPVIDFKRGSFLEGVQGYALLDSSLRFSRDASEHLEVYYQMNPDESSMTVLLLFATGAVVLNNVPLDSARFDAVATQKSFINSGLAGKVVDAGDEMVITPQFSEKLFPSRGSVRNFKSKLASQTVRGPVLAVGLAQAHRLPDLSPELAQSMNLRRTTTVNWLLTKKLMIKAASETRQFNEMIGQTVSGVPDRIIEWGLNGATVTMTGIDGPAGSLRQTFNDEFQQQLGSHAHRQVKELKDKAMQPVLQGSSTMHQTLNQVLIDFSIGGLIVMASAQADFKMGGSTLVSSRIGKGAGLSFMLRTLGHCVIEPVASCVNNVAYDFVVNWMPTLAPLFRRDYLVEIDHGVTPPQSGAKQASPLPSSSIRDEL